MSTSPFRVLWIFCVLLASTFVGTTGGMLAWLSGDPVAKAILTGGAAFAAATTLGVLLLNYIGSAPTGSSPVEPARRIIDVPDSLGRMAHQEDRPCE